MSKIILGGGKGEGGGSKFRAVFITCVKRVELK